MIDKVRNYPIPRAERDGNVPQQHDVPLFNNLASVLIGLLTTKVTIMIKNQGNPRKVKEGEVVNWRDAQGDVHTDKVSYLYKSALGYQCAALTSGHMLRVNELM